jgi:hypothetical protein
MNLPKLNLRLDRLEALADKKLIKKAEQMRRLDEAIASAQEIFERHGITVRPEGHTR